MLPHSSPPWRRAATVLALAGVLAAGAAGLGLPRALRSQPARPAPPWLRAVPAAGVRAAAAGPAAGLAAVAGDAPRVQPAAPGRPRPGRTPTPPTSTPT